MTSKYDAYWEAQLDQIGAALQPAVDGSAATVDVANVRRLGERQSWYGVAEVCGRKVIRSSMAHAASLGRTVAASGICVAWPERTFRFTIGAAGVLTITAADRRARPGQSTANRQGQAAAGDVAVTQGDEAVAPRENGPHARSTTGRRAADTDQFYLLLSELARRVGGQRLLRDCAGGHPWPRHGVYFFFEDGETRADGSGRVVRIGTHALTTTSQTTLWNRLSQHRGHLKGRNRGGGNHRASVFRRHVGAALIRRHNCPEDLLASWLDRNHPTQWADREDDIERQVSRYIGAMPFLWLNVSDRADRGYVERNSIALLSCLTGGPDLPSASWLGRDAPRSEIRESGLWNVQHVHDHYDPAFLHLLAGLVQSVQ